LVSAARDNSQEMVPVMEQRTSVAVRIIRKAGPTGNIPTANASMIRAGFIPAGVAKDFGVSIAVVRKLAAT